MKWTRSELLRQSQKVTFDEEVEIDASVFDGNSRINSVKDVRVDGTGWLDDSADCFYAELHVTGIMLCPDAITGEEIEVPSDIKGYCAVCVNGITLGFGKASNGRLKNKYPKGLRTLK